MYSVYHAKYSLWSMHEMSSGILKYFKGTVHWYRNHAITCYFTACEIVIVNIFLQEFVEFVINDGIRIVRSETWTANNEITSEKWNLPNVNSVACYSPHASLGNNELLCLPYQLLITIYNHCYLLPGKFPWLRRNSMLMWDTN